ncbi:glycosyltransferase family 2 protein [Microbacterium sp. ET2]|uniref:glycosyltransferase family 2 protein n=1 Tax=Microbacterium albipurpureum TaxID=3050384 RepID=UPI00259CEEBF|nr:glycosyltransferase family 2 protein [Microbacterium sp. ET2 (Ac-2212)]WJL96577.1 glycosyltransferase family 2 protein [Microbacterium sp. ET2 (Ac-2212)]
MSVVVPVYVPGAAIDPLLASLDRQTLPSDQFEVLLCDDGSGKQTAEQLAGIAVDRPNVRVLSLPHTGWPGTPRNHGIDAAAGTYVQFVDQDDYLFDAALERLCDFADRNGSDIVVGREVGVGRRIPRRIFRHDVPRATLGDDPLLDMLTPHKLFRTAFLREHGIRYPDGRVRLEDHLFVMRAYLAARTISILSSEPCYAWVRHPGSASSSRIDPDQYFPHLANVLALVDAHVEQGDLRDRLLRHWYRGKMLRRIAGQRLMNYPEAYRTRFFDAALPLVRRWVGDGVEEGLPPAERVRSRLLRADRRDDLADFARWESELRCRVTVTSARWTRGGGLALALSVGVTRGETDAAASLSEGDAGEWTADPSLRPFRDALIEAAGTGRRDRVAVSVRTDRGDSPLAKVSRPTREGVRLAIDPLRAFAGEAGPGGTLVASVRRAGWAFDVPVTAGPGALAGVRRSPILAGRPCRLEVGDDGGARVHRDPSRGRGREVLARTVRAARARLGAVRGR